MATSPLYAMLEVLSDGVALQFPVPFDYMGNTDYVKVYSRDPANPTVDPVLVPSYSVVGNYVFLGSPVPNGMIVRIRRETPLDKNLVDWTNTSFPTRTNMNTMERQLLYLIQEVGDRISFETVSQGDIDIVEYESEQRDADLQDQIDEEIINRVNAVQILQDQVTKNTADNAVSIKYDEDGNIPIIVGADFMGVLADGTKVSLLDFLPSLEFLIGNANSKLEFNSSSRPMLAFGGGSPSGVATLADVVLEDGISLSDLNEILGNYAKLGTNGEIPAGLLPSDVLPKLYEVDTVADLVTLANVAKVNDDCYISDPTIPDGDPKLYKLVALPASDLSNWVAIDSTLISLVVSVNGKQGVVTLYPTDIPGLSDYIKATLSSIDFTFNGNVEVPTQLPDDNSNHAASTEWVKNLLQSYLKSSGGALTGSVEFTNPAARVLFPTAPGAKIVLSGADANNWIRLMTETDAMVLDVANGYTIKMNVGGTNIMEVTEEGLSVNGMNITEIAGDTVTEVTSIQANMAIAETVINYHTTAINDLIARIKYGTTAPVAASTDKEGDVFLVYEP